MISFERLSAIAQEALTNPRAARYDVHALTPLLRVYPFQSSNGAVPSIVAQFAVVNRFEPSIQRVISIARSALGFAVWCGDKYTQGDLPVVEAGLRIGEALEGVPAEHADFAQEDMLGAYGAFMRSAPCHFWKAWHSHQGVCKHVAAVFQHLERHHEAGLLGLLEELDEGYAHVMNLDDEQEVVAVLEAAAAPTPEAARGELLSFVAGLATRHGGLSSEDYVRLEALVDGVANARG